VRGSERVKKFLATRRQANSDRLKPGLQTQRPATSLCRYDANLLGLSRRVYRAVSRWGFLFSREKGAGFGAELCVPKT